MAEKVGHQCHNCGRFAAQLRYRESGHFFRGGYLKAVKAKREAAK
jgi:hypothetical protein